MGLKNGDRLSGTVEGIDGTTLTLTTEHIGTVKIAAKHIAGVETDGPVTIRIEGLGWRTGRLTTDYSGVVRVIRSDGAVSTPVALGTVTRLQPGLHVPLGFQWRGRVNAGMTERSGNTHSRNWHLDAQVTGRAEEDRIRLRGELNREFDGYGNKTADNFLTAIQHDRFVSEQVFLYTSGKLERDRPADLRLRTTVGGGGGYQFIETETTELSAHAGPAYVMEKGTVAAEEEDNLFITSSTGLRFPFGHGLSATAQLDMDYDNQPAPGVSSADKTYLITLGYAW